MSLTINQVEGPNDRQRLPDRRPSARVPVSFVFSDKTIRTYDVTFGFDAEGTIREVFAASGHTQSDLGALIEDACIAASIAMQRGHTISELAQSFGELREEGQGSGPPASLLGAIARAGAELEVALRETSFG